MVELNVLPDLLLCLCEVDPQTFLGLKAKNNVFQNAKLIDQHEFLMHHTDSMLDRDAGI